MSEASWSLLLRDAILAPPTKKVTGTLTAAGRTIGIATLKIRGADWSASWGLGKLKAGSYTVTYKADGALVGTLLLTVRP